MIGLLVLAGFLTALVGPELIRNTTGTMSVSNTGVFQLLSDGTISLIPSVAQALLTSMRAAGTTGFIQNGEMIVSSGLNEGAGQAQNFPAATAIFNLHLTYDIWISTAIIMGQAAQVIPVLSHQFPILNPAIDPPIATSLNQAVDMTRACMVLFSSPGTLLS